MYIPLLLQNGANPNFTGMDGKTPLFIACARDKASIISILLEAQADPGVLDKNQNHCFHFTQVFDFRVSLYFQ